MINEDNILMITDLLHAPDGNQRRLGESLGWRWWASRQTRGFGVDSPTAGGLSPKAKPDNIWTLECLWRHQIGFY